MKCGWNDPDCVHAARRPACGYPDPCSHDPCARGGGGSYVLHSGLQSLTLDFIKVLRDNVLADSVQFVT